MKLSYKQKLFIYFFIVFAAFTVVITFFQQNREKAYKTETLRTTLDDYSDIIARYVQQHSDKQRANGFFKECTRTYALQLTINNSGS